MRPSANWIRGRSTSIIEEVSGRVAFQYPNFRYFMMARFLATLSSEMQAIAVGWQVYGLTHRPLDLGLVGLAQFLPGVLLFLVSGQAADRFPRRRIVMACYAGFAACSLALLALTLSPQPSGLADLCGFAWQRRRAVVQRRGRAIVPAVADSCGTFSQRRGLEFFRLYRRHHPGSRHRRSALWIDCHSGAGLRLRARRAACARCCWPPPSA